MSEIPRARELDKLLASLILASLLLHFGFVFYLHQMDWPRQAEEIPDQYWHLLPPRPVFALPQPPQPAPPAASTPGKPGVAHHSTTPAPHLAPTAAVARVAVLQALGGGAIRDLIDAGKLDADQAFDRVGGVSLDSRRGLEMRTKLETGSKYDGAALKAQGPGGVLVGRRGDEHLVKTAMRIEPPEAVIGGLPPEVIVATVRQRLGGIRACFERTLDHNGVAGKVTLRFAVTPSGAVDSVEVEEDTLRDSQVTACMKARVAGWHFPPAPRPSEFSFPFIFQSAE